MSSESRYEGYEPDYSDQSETSFVSKSRPNSEKRTRPTQGRKRGKVPSSFNGMHRRRRRKMAW